MFDHSRQDADKLQKILSENGKDKNDIIRMILEGKAWDGEGVGPSSDEKLFAMADGIRREVYGDEVYIRGLIEITNFCRNDCYYCGIRKSNRGLDRYRLDKETILSCCRTGYELGFRTFVLQGGEDPFFTDDIMCDIISRIHEEFPDCAITLSLGERSAESYRRLFEAGGRRYLLRHEAADEGLYRRLHPEEMSPENRKKCLYELKETGFQVGAGIMIGAPFQTIDHIMEDIRFMEELGPDMIGVGPFMHHEDTPFGQYSDGSMELTLRVIALCRMIFPHALIPSTTALASISPNGRARGLKAGANVIMPNLSPADCRDKYSIYNNKAATGLESAQGLENLKKTVAEAGYRIVTDIGDVKR